ncbi:TPA: hypothetical protein N0F65_000370 [Lagenidium giganteum]|uniref:Uncharacterized protein n=1 Tax=Lagenidium giganteum TaxID=4803 RepID=A0AAV2Z3C2_9STRA|nr:TPA: hypothetical protein N0F65_000370 [Lagenidium giganteum]
MFSTGVAAFLALLASIPAPAEAHTWIDCLDTSRTKIYDKSQEYIFGGAKSNGICDGYGAGYPGRGVADIGPAYTHKMLKDQAKAGASVCQNVDNAPYTGWRKRLVADAGVPIYFSYLPNGHIVKDKMARGTKHGVYWTGKVGSKLSKSSEMTAENLVDGRTMDFDDGNCGESLDLQGKPSGRAGDGKPCVGSFTIPQGTAPGIYHFVWYWTFYRDDGNYADPVTAKGYFGAAYSTCFEVEVKGASGNASCCVRGFRVDVDDDDIELTANPDMIIGEQGTGPGKFVDPVAVDVNARGEMVVGDAQLSRVQGFSGSGQLLYHFGKAGTNRGEISQIADVKFTPLGQVAVLDGAMHRLQVFSPTGVVVLTIGKEGWQNSEFQSPCALAIARTGEIFVCDKGNKRIQRFSSKGKLLSVWGSRRHITKQWLAAAKEQISVPVPPLRSIFQSPADVAVGHNGDIVVCDSGSDQIFFFTDAGLCMHVMPLPVVRGERQTPVALVYCKNFVVVAAKAKRSVASRDVDSDKIEPHMFAAFPSFTRVFMGKFDVWPTDCVIRVLRYLTYDDAMQLRLVNHYLHVACRQLRNHWQLYPLMTGTPSVIKYQRVVERATGLVAVKEAFDKWSLRIHTRSAHARKHTMDYQAGFTNAMSTLFGPLYCYQHEDVLRELFCHFASTSTNGRPELRLPGFIEIVTLVTEVDHGYLEWEHTPPFRDGRRPVPVIREPIPPGAQLATLNLVETAQHAQLNKIIRKLQAL